MRIKSIAVGLKFDFLDAIKLFFKKRATNFAASSTFFMVLSFVPLLLLLIRLVGLFIGSWKELDVVSIKVFKMIQPLFPDLTTKLFQKLQELVGGALFASSKTTLINFGVLIWSSVSFLNSIWDNLYLMTDDEAHLSYKRYFKGMILLAVVIGLISISITLPGILYFIRQSIRDFFIYDFIVNNFSILGTFLKFVVKNDFGITFLMKTSIFNFFSYLFFFTFLYHWFFQQRIKWTAAFIGSLSFVFIFSLAKHLFWIYITYFSKGLKSNYGAFYTTLVGIVWIYFVMIFFYFGACVSLTSKTKFLTKE